MEKPVKLITLLQKSLANDKICMYYHGRFNDTFTDKLISIADYDTAKQTKKRIAYLMTESFQNIIRHGETTINNDKEGVFGIRGIEPFLHIFSSNMVNSKNKPDLEEKLYAINHLNKDELRAYYLEILEEGEFNEKGGGGLGLIEMAKKSERPLQVEFKKLAEDIFAFNMQIDLKVDEIKENEAPSPISIKENLRVNDILLQHNIIFLYKGDFNDEVITPMLTILENNTTQSKNSIGYKIYHTAVELMQNVARHMSSNIEKREGIFVLLKSPNGFYISTGNYINDDGKDISQSISKINSLNKTQLDELYRSELKKSVTNGKSNAGVGLIDVRRNLMTPIDVNVNDNYLVIGIEVPLN